MPPGCILGKPRVSRTVFGICNPEGQQRTVYNGYTLQFQSVALSNILIANLYMIWLRGNVTIQECLKTGLLNSLEKVAYSSRREVLCLCGNRVYHLRPHWMALANWGGPGFTVNIQAISSVWVSNEQLFDDVFDTYTFSSFSRFQEQLAARVKCNWKTMCSCCTF